MKLDNIKNFWNKISYEKPDINYISSYRLEIKTKKWTRRVQKARYDNYYCYKNKYYRKFNFR